MLQKIKKRIRNPKVILGIMSGVLMILVNLGIIDELASENVIEITNMILGVGVAIGILSNPESHIKPNEPKEEE
ncbi:holin [Geobacillus phage GR1]|nr:holin [Geobacillus phage GR1]